MPVVIRTDKPIDLNTISDQIDDCVLDFFREFKVDVNDLSQMKSIPHNTLTLCMRYIYDHLFKPDRNMVNNQKSLIDYNDCEMLQLLANKFLELCLRFNKSLGLMSFGFMIGCDYSTLMRWLSDKESNPVRWQILKGIQEGHKAVHIGLLNETPVGALAVANNDLETGLEWSRNQAQQITNNTVYYIPSEQSKRLQLEESKD